MNGLLLTFWPYWAECLIIGISLFVLLCTAGVAIGKAGRHPIWALALLVPIVQIIVFWLFAYKRWPARD